MPHSRTARRLGRVAARSVRDAILPGCSCAERNQGQIGRGQIAEGESVRLLFLCAGVCRGCPSLRRLGALWPGKQSTELDGSFHQGDSCAECASYPQAMPSDLGCVQESNRSGTCDLASPVFACLACSGSLWSLEHRMVDQIEKAEVAETQRPPCEESEGAWLPSFLAQVGFPSLSLSFRNGTAMFLARSG